MLSLDWLDDFTQPFSWRSSLSRVLDFLNKLFLPGVHYGTTMVLIWYYHDTIVVLLWYYHGSKRHDLADSLSSYDPNYLLN